MSHRPNGNRKTKTPCPWCGASYGYTNYMRRYGVRADDGTLLSDTHQIACYRKHRGVRHADRPAPAG